MAWKACPRGARERGARGRGEGAGRAVEYPPGERGGTRGGEGPGLAGESEVLRRFGRILAGVGTLDCPVEFQYLASLELLPDRVRITNLGWDAGSKKAEEAIAALEAGETPRKPKLKLLPKPLEVPLASITEVRLDPPGPGRPLGCLSLKRKRERWWHALTKRSRAKIFFTAAEEEGFARLAEEIRARLPEK